MAALAEMLSYGHQVWCQCRDVATSGDTLLNKQTQYLPGSRACGVLQGKYLPRRIFTPRAAAADEGRCIIQEVFSLGNGHPPSFM